MQPHPPALQLAQRLRQLRLQWSDARLTQESSWPPRSAPRRSCPRPRCVVVGKPQRAEAPAATSASHICAVLCHAAIGSGGPALLALEDLTADEKARV